MIKSNIDLTSNEMFCRQPFNPLKNFRHGFPWTPLFDITLDDCERARYEVVFTGDRSTREEKELCRQEDSGNYCDFCGAPLDTIPWDRTWGLCKRCNEDMEKSYGNKPKYPWGDKYEMEAQRGSISLI